MYTTFQAFRIYAREVPFRMLAKLAVLSIRVVRAVAALYAVLSGFGLLVAIMLHSEPSAALAEVASASPYTVAIQGTAFAISVLLFLALRVAVNHLHGIGRPGEQLLRSNWQI